MLLHTHTKLYYISNRNLYHKKQHLVESVTLQEYTTFVVEIYKNLRVKLRLRSVDDRLSNVWFSHIWGIELSRAEFVQMSWCLVEMIRAEFKRDELMFGSADKPSPPHAQVVAISILIKTTWEGQWPQSDKPDTIRGQHVSSSYWHLLNITKNTIGHLLKLGCCPRLSGIPSWFRKQRGQAR